MKDLIRTFAGECDGQTLAVLYFSGHGVQVGGKDYMIPVRADIRIQADVEEEAVDIDWTLRQIEDRKPKTGLLFLDACRDNPLPAGVKGTDKGLLPVRDHPGFLVAFAYDAPAYAGAAVGFAPHR